MIINRIGQQLGNYQLMSLLGQGGFAEVYLGEHIHLKTQVAVKVLYSHVTTQNIQAFISEAQIVAALKHPHILRVLDFGFEQGVPFLVMDYAPGGTLRDRHPSGFIVPLPTILWYVKQVTSALEYAHARKLVHRDVKPENMLIDSEDNILLSDFGIAAVARSAISMKTIDSAGTVDYMPPEQIKGKPCPASDQYALATAVYEWLCGVRPFAGNTPIEVAVQQLSDDPLPLRQRVPSIALDLEQVVLKALAKESEQRFASVQAFAQALEQCAGLSNGAREKIENYGKRRNEKWDTFVHQAKLDNLRKSSTIIDHPDLNNNPNALLLVTQNWNPGGRGGVYNRHVVGVRYDGRYWRIFNEDNKAMTIDTSFNVTVLKASASAFIHRAMPKNSYKNYTIIDHAALNNNPGAIILVTQNWNPGGGSGMYNNHTIGVWYTHSGKWSIYNQDLAVMPEKAAFNVLAVNAETMAFVHQATALTINENFTVLNSVELNERPDAIIQVTQNWNPEGSKGVYNSHEMGVWYTPSGRWSIYNQDLDEMPLRASFNIAILQNAGFSARWGQSGKYVGDSRALDESPGM